MNKQMRIEKAELFSILSNTINGANFDDLNEAVYKIYDVAGYRKQRDLYYLEEGKPPVLIETSENKQSEGEWLGDWDYECSVCHEYHDVKTNFCPNCGAKMKGENNG